MSIFVISLLVLYLAVVELFDWPERMGLLRSKYPRVWKLMNDRTGRVVLLVFAISLLAVDLVERHKAPAELHTHVEFVPPAMLAVEPAIPFTEGKIPKIEIGYINGTSVSPVRNASMIAKLYYHAPFTEKDSSGDDMYSDFLKTAKFLPSESQLFEQNKLRHHTFYGPPLTKDQSDALTAGTLLLCAAAAVKWEDDTGKYRTEQCMCMEPQRHVGAIPPWAEASKHNGEVKLGWFSWL